MEGERVTDVAAGSFHCLAEREGKVWVFCQLAAMVISLVQRGDFPYLGLFYIEPILWRRMPSGRMSYGKNFFWEEER